MGHGKLISAAIGTGAWLIAAALNIVSAPELLGWIFFALGSGCLITAALWWLHRSFQPPGTTPGAATSPPGPVPPLAPERDEPESDERTFIDVTPTYLVGLFKGHTDLQAMKLTEPFVGKWMKVTGPLGNVLSNRPDISQVTLQNKSIFDPEYEPLTVYMYFDRKQWDDRLAVLPPGRAITVVGRLKEFDRITIHLEHCELQD